MIENMVRPERFELPASSSGGKRSIQLSYGRLTPVYMERMASSIQGCCPIMAAKKCGNDREKIPIAPAKASQTQPPGTLRQIRASPEAVTKYLPGSVFRGAGANAVAAAQPDQELAFRFEIAGFQGGVVGILQ